jgi:hypothetical protein
MTNPDPKAALERIYSELRMVYCHLTCAAIAIEKTDAAETNSQVCAATYVLTEQLARLDKLTHEIDSVVVALNRPTQRPPGRRSKAANVVELRSAS